MAWTSGFFNSVNGDRLYNADQMSRLFEGLITDGVYASVGNKMAVQPNSGMTIQIATGRGWFGRHWVKTGVLSGHRAPPPPWYSAWVLGCQPSSAGGDSRSCQGRDLSMAP